MPKAKSVLVYTMTPELCEALRRLSNANWRNPRDVYKWSLDIAKYIDAQTVTTPAEKRRAKR